LAAVSGGGGTLRAADWTGPNGTRVTYYFRHIGSEWVLDLDYEFVPLPPSDLPSTAGVEA
jgi:hypothetical protein